MQMRRPVPRSTTDESHADRSRDDDEIKTRTFTVADELRERISADRVAKLYVVAVAPHLVVLRNLSANGASEDASVSTRGPIGRSSSMQASSEKSQIGKRASTHSCRRNGHCIYCKRKWRCPEHDMLLGWSAQAPRCCVTALVLI